MSHLQIFNAIKADFSAEIALSVCQIHAINLTIKAKQKDLVSGNRTRRVEKRAKKLLWRLADEDFTLVIGLWGLIHDWETRQAMHGLGGCEKKTFLELLQKA